jgi:hypothetical protein
VVAEPPPAATPVADTPVEEDPVEEDPVEEVVDNMISGSVIKGPVDGAIIIAFEFDGITEIGRGETDENGSFTISIGDNAGGVLLKASGGTYTDEATGAENVQFGSAEMRAAYMIPEALTPPFEATINVTPYTELAVREAIVEGAIDAQMLADANSDFFNLGENAIDIITTLPTNPLTDSASEGTVEDLYGVYISVVSQIVADQGLVSWDGAVDLLESSADVDTLVATALNALASSDNAAGANITVEAATVALEAIVDVIATGSGDPADGGGSTAGGSGMTPCISGTAVSISVPSGLAGASGDLTLSFAASGSGLTQGVVQMFDFGSNGSLTLDGHLLSSSPYSCGTSETLWYEELMDRVFSVSFTSAGAFNELNLNGSDGTFLGQYTDENGDFASVTNIASDSASGEDVSVGGGTVGGDERAGSSC